MWVIIQPHLKYISLVSSVWILIPEIHVASGINHLDLKNTYSRLKSTLQDTTQLGKSQENVRYIFTYMRVGGPSLKCEALWISAEIYICSNLYC